MDLFKTFKTDEAKEQEGVWVPLDETTRLRIARMKNARYKAALQRKLEGQKFQVRAQAMTDEAYQKILNEVVAETILVDWEGITEQGVPLPYSVENAMHLLTVYPDFRDSVVLTAANDAELFRPDMPHVSTPSEVIHG